MRLRTTAAFAAMAVPLLLTSEGASAIPITGVLRFTGNVRITNTRIDFLPLAAGPFSYIQMLGPDQQEGSFVAIANASGFIRNLDRSLFPVGPQPVLFPFTSSFISPGGDMGFDLTYILPGTYSSTECFLASASGQECTPPPDAIFGASPFNFSNQTASSSRASFQVRGYFFNHNTRENTQAIGTFSIQKPTQSYQDLLTTLAQQGEVTTEYFAEFNMVPEPGTLALGLMGLGFIAFQKLWRKVAGISAGN
jgi:hypothetical protein